LVPLGSGERTEARHGRDLRLQQVARKSARRKGAHARVRGRRSGRASVDLDDATLLGSVREELASPWLGISGPPVLARVFRFSKASPQPVLGHPERVARIQGTLTGLPGLHLIGNAYDGVGIPDCVRGATEVAAYIVRSSVRRSA